ncbi:MAG TPA: DUF4197 domain-containing protein [Cytophagaceae bacterium]
MKTRKLIILGIILTFSLNLYAQVNLGKIKVPKSVTKEIPGSTTAASESEIASGLKEALTIGANKASSELNQVDGYNKNTKVRIPFPEDAQKVAKTLRDMGFGSKVDEFELTLNRAAEQAAKEAAPIFVSAIKEMTISDAKNILTGPDTAATGYLRKTTYNPLYDSFSPHIANALNSTQATQKWTEITTIYNKFSKNKVETDLVKYTTNKALKGLFILVAEEELKIRKDPLARTTDLLKKVFGSN